MKNPFFDCRREEAALARRRIGHARFSNGYLMEKGPPPYCDDCIVPLSVDHVLVECSSYKGIRDDCFSNIPGPLSISKILTEGHFFFAESIFRFCRGDILSKI